MAKPDLLAKAVRHHQAGRLAEAEALYRRILQAQPRHGDALHLLGVIAYQRQDPGTALALIGQAIALCDTVADYHLNLGNVLQTLERLDEAVAAFRRAIALQPDHAVAHYNLGNALKQLDRLDEAVAAYAGAIALRPDYAEAHYNLGNALNALGRFGDAIAAYRQAVLLRPDYWEAHNNLGGVLRRLERLDEAAAAYRRALEIQPAQPEGQANLAVILRGQGRLDEALAACRAALERQPDLAEAHNTLGSILRDQGRLDEAIVSYRQALGLRPAHAETHSNLGNALLDRGDVDAAMAAYATALGLQPDLPDAHWNLALARLLSGDFAGGWPEYEWRWQTRQNGNLAVKPRFPQPPWSGEDLAGRLILLHDEQGLGDTLQFVRYVPLVAARAGRVILGVRRPLGRLFAGLAGGVEIAHDGDTLPDFDWHCPLLSLPRAFGTTLETIPRDVPYLSAEPDQVAAWRARLARPDRAEGLRVGLCWQGNPEAKADRGRSMPLAALAPLTRLSGLRLISLQKAHGLDQLAQRPLDLEVETLGPDWDAGPDAFIDTAAVMASLDLVLTVDTAIAHLAGALARPVWVMLKSVPDWRWLMARDDSPWYPTMRLFRQSRPGDWEGVVAQVARELAAVLAGDRARLLPSPAAGANRDRPRSGSRAVNRKDDAVMSDPAAALSGEALAVGRSRGNAAIFYHPDAYVSDREQVKGRHAAGAGFFKGLITHGRLETLYCCTDVVSYFEDCRRRAAALGGGVPVVKRLDPRLLRSLAEPGCLFLPGPGLAEWAWRRRSEDERGFSLCGITHTISSDRVMEEIGQFLIAPVQPWDALICTSRAVKAAVEALLDDHADYLAERLGARPASPVRLPVIPLGVDCAAFAEDATTATRRAELRRRLGLAAEDVAALFVGRLSFHAKAHPVPMFMALERAQAQLPGPGRLHLLLAGQFPNDGIAAEFTAAAARFCPAVPVHVLNGADTPLVQASWAAADLFVSLSDNIQESFGLTPIEAMAAGLPCVVSDWDGYRDTVLDGETGFRVATATPPAAAGVDLAARYQIGADNFDYFIGAVSQATAVDIDGAATAFVRLTTDPALRRQMGAAGRQRARTTYDWSAIVGQYQALWQELAELRRCAAILAPRRRGRAAYPLRADPFRMYGTYPTRTLAGPWQVQLAVPDPDRLLALVRQGTINTFAGHTLLAAADIDAVLERLRVGPQTIAELVDPVAPPQRGTVLRTLVWLNKYGIVAFTP